jgi:hypothetical protein
MFFRSSQVLDRAMTKVHNIYRSLKKDSESSTTSCT